MSVLELVKDRFEFGWYFKDGRVLFSSDPALGSCLPTAYEGSEPVYEPYSPAVGHPTIVCPRCMEPSWAVSRHAVERHGDNDVTIQPALPGRTPPDWFSPDWI